LQDATPEQKAKQKGLMMKRSASLMKGGNTKRVIDVAEDARSVANAPPEERRDVLYSSLRRLEISYG